MTTLGKRHRNSSSLRRTTSMSGFAAPGEEQPARAARGGSAAPAPAPATEAGTGTGTGWGAVERRNSADCHAAAADTAPFLKACGLCSRRLGPGRDTFIYMGEVAFCSLECRQEQINIDDRKEKKCFPPAGSGGSDQSGSTVAAA